MQNPNGIKTAYFIAGVDEAGRGPLAGPVLAAAVILDPMQSISGLTDSKQLSATRRETLYHIIQNQAIAWAIGRAEVSEIDQINIFQASLLAMQRAVSGLTVSAHHVMIDGTHCPKLVCSSEAIVKGDQKIPAISAASILAKVMRDREMMYYDKLYPDYGFAQHKGYGTKMHLDALKKLGPCLIHRRSFAPVRASLLHTQILQD